MEPNALTEKQIREANQLADRILRSASVDLIYRARYLDLALNKLKFQSVLGESEEEAPTNSFASDGIRLFYDPRYVLRTYRLGPNHLNHLYLHTVLHCVFLHNFAAPVYRNDPEKRRLYDLSCDIAVECMISEFEERMRDATSVQEDLRMRSAISEIQKQVPTMTAERIFKYLLQANLPVPEMLRLTALFAFDDHSIWYEVSEDADGKGSGGGEGNEEGGSQNNGGGGGQGNPDENDGNSGSGQGDSDDSDGNSSQSGGGQDSEQQSAEDSWKNVCERLRVDLETASANIGNQSGTMMQNIRDVTRERYDYSAFLRKFAVLGEEMHVSEDEFDYVFYTHGLNLYGNVPLIEPLEYREVKRIRDFVVAIDTSGSVSGDLVQCFMQKTYNILSQAECYFRKINIHIIQCDADVQHDFRITSQEEFEAYIKSFKLYGFGGTDFRPVFRRVDQLIEAGEFENLKGLIYFTDGYGVFPEKKPDYETAFVMISDFPENTPEVPPWAIKLVLTAAEIEEQ